MLQPHSQWSNGVLFRVPERVDPTAKLLNPRCLICLTRLLITRDSLSNDRVVSPALHYDTTRVANVGAEQLLAHGQHGDARGAAESDIEDAAEQLIVAVEEGVVECDAHLVRVQVLFFLRLLQVLGVSFEHELKLCLEVLRQLLLEVAAHLLTVLAVAIGDREEVAELHPTEVRHRDPHVLVDLVRVRR